MSYTESGQMLIDKNQKFIKFSCRSVVLWKKNCNERMRAINIAQIVDWLILKLWHIAYVYLMFVYC